MGRMHVIGAEKFAPFSREESVWFNIFRRVMVQLPVRSGAKWKICGRYLSGGLVLGKREDANLDDAASVAGED